MFKLLLLTCVAVVNAQNRNNYMYYQMDQKDDQHSRNYNNHQNDYSYKKCPTLKGSGNHDFEELDGLWFRIQQTPNEDQAFECSLQVFQVEHNMHKFLLRVPRKNNDERREITIGVNKKIDESTWFGELDTNVFKNKDFLVTVLDSDYHGDYDGSALLHVCNRNTLRQQSIILSRKRQLNRKTIERYHKTLKKNGLDEFEMQLRDVRQHNCIQKAQSYSD